MLVQATLTLLFGTLLGLRFRALVLLPASVAVLAAAAAAGQLTFDSVPELLLAVFAALLVLQIGYLAGAAMALANRRSTAHGFRNRTYHSWY